MTDEHVFLTREQWKLLDPRIRLTVAAIQGMRPPPDLDPESSEYVDRQAENNAVVMAPLLVPMRRYFPPDGGSQLGELTIINAYTPERVEQIKRIREAGMEFTIEVLSMGMVNICLDTGESDYRFEVVTPEKVNAKVLELIDTFDLDKFRAYQANAAAAMFMDPEAQREAE